MDLLTFWEECVKHFTQALFTIALVSISLGTTAQAKKITVMSYNVENLFDTFHDEGKADFTYLPKWVKKQNPEVYEYCRAEKNKFYREECYNIDWTIEKLGTKLDSLTKVIKIVGRGQGPDIISLQEVENINVLNFWMKRSLSAMGYKEVILLEGPDNRGIDGAILSKFPLAEDATYHDFIPSLSLNDVALSFLELSGEKLVFAAAKKTGKPKRGILEARFNVGGGKQVTVLTNHWPSQSPGNPPTDRYEIAELMHNIAVEADTENRALLSMGDFNTLDSDQPHGLNEWAFNKRRKIHFYDARAEYLVEAGSNASGLPGSHWYKGHYAALDKILVLESTVAQVEPDWLSFKTIAEDFMMERADSGPFKLKPRRFNFNTAEGFADHLPITLDLKI